MYYEDLVETAVEPDIYSETHSADKIKLPVLSKRADSNYEKYKLPFNKNWKDGKYYHTIVVENYGSGQQGTKIRNAVTGQKYPYLVGSLDEDLFFKVSEASGRNGRRSTLILFYDSPEQYENHCFTTVDNDIKKKWNEKYLIARRRMRID